MSKGSYNYIDSVLNYSRQETISVNIGEVTVGGGTSIKLQSMCDTDTKDIEATTDQIISIVDNGADIVRVAVQGMREAEALKGIKQRLLNRGVNTPIVADIHFTPSAAECAAEYVDKVRVNPGNFYDPRAKFKSIEYNEISYQEELILLQEKFSKFVIFCKQRGRAIRIGANHGSLSDRIMSRYGDTPEGIVESVMEFLSVCKVENFLDVVISIKSSNTRTMVYTTRLMNQRMRELGTPYPLHIGVTEAGEGEDGRVVSAVGSGTLLVDGLGDTIRVSLTEDPANEVPFAKELVKQFQTREGHPPIRVTKETVNSPYRYKRRETNAVLTIGGSNTPLVVANYREGDIKADLSIKNDILITEGGGQTPILSLKSYIENSKEDRTPQDNSIVKAISFNKEQFDKYIKGNTTLQRELKQERSAIFIIYSNHINPVAEMRALFMELDNIGSSTPVIIQRDYSEESYEQLSIKASIDIGPLLIDGYGDAIFINSRGNTISLDAVCSLSYSILQASKVRTTKMEFISCPGCGRTLFDLKSTVVAVKERLKDLKPLKIGIMGCIVNGPGEMGDVDYGYVGSGKDKVNLYKGQNLIKQNIPTDNALEELIDLIKESGDWEYK